MKQGRFIAKFASFGALATVIAGVVLVFSSELAVATSSAEAGAQAAKGDGVVETLIGSGGIITTIVNIMLFIVGALSVIMLVIGGLRYVVSGGNATAVSSAKSTILYAIIGLIISLLAYAAVNFVLTTFSSGINGSGIDI